MIFEENIHTEDTVGDSARPVDLRGILILFGIITSGQHVLHLNLLVDWGPPEYRRRYTLRNMCLVDPFPCIFFRVIRILASVRALVTSPTAVLKSTAGRKIPYFRTKLKI